MNVEGKIAIDADSPQLAAMNLQLISDEGHRNSMSAAELEERMRKWLGGEYEAAIFAVNRSTVAYALYKRETDWIFLRQFFVVPELRRQGIGRAAMNWLLQNPWRDAPRIRLDVLVGNADGIAFWRSIGFQEYCITMEMDSPVQLHDTVNRKLARCYGRQDKA